MKVLVFGKGYVGTQYVDSDVFTDCVFADADITKLSEVEQAVASNKPDVVINAAGKTNLEWCFAHKIEAMKVNVGGALNILMAAKQAGAALVHLSSGCIYEGAGKDGKGFTEDDPPSPGCFYAETKVAADELLLESGYEQVLVLRLRQPFGYGAHPRSIITKILAFHKAIDSKQSITFVPDLIQATKQLLDSRQYGVYNLCNPGTMSPYEIAIMAHKMLNTGQQVEAINKQVLDELDSQAGREHRVDTILNMSKLEHAGCVLPPITERVQEVLKTYTVDNSETTSFAHT